MRVDLLRCADEKVRGISRQRASSSAQFSCGGQKDGSKEYTEWRTFIAIQQFGSHRKAACELTATNTLIAMSTTDIYGFAHEDIDAARKAIENALSLRLEEAPEEDLSGDYYRAEIPFGPGVQIRRNSAPHIRWQGDPSNLWHPEFGLLVFVHGNAPEAVAERLKQCVPGLSFLETRRSM
jgi:hypothetical protein